MDAVMTFSGELEPAVEILREFFEKKAKDILSKGAPGGKGAEVISWKIEGKELKLKIVSGRYVRPHDAILRFRKNLGAILGPKFKIGVRSIRGDRYVITFPIDKMPLENFSIPFAKNLKFKEGECYMLIENIDEKFIEENYADRMISLIREKIDAQHYKGKSEHWEMIWSSGKKEHFFKKDPTQELLKRKLIKHGSSRGQWIYGFTVTKIMRTFEKIVENEILKPLGFFEMIFPKLVTWDIWKKSGHCKNIYPEIYYICTPKTRDVKYWEDVIDMFKITGDVPVEKVKDKIEPPLGGMTYAQCPPFWPYLHGETLSNDSIPMKVFDRSGTSHRYESGGIHGIERVDEFHRIEVLWVGTIDQTVEIADEINDKYKYVFNEILELEWRMARVTPWFMAQEGLMGLDERKVVGTIDYEAFLPYREGTAEEWLEFQNVSVNGDKYPKVFNVKLQSGEELWSGCSGIGLQRWAAAFLAQKGIDPDNWPKKFREYFGEMPKEVRFL